MSDIVDIENQYSYHSWQWCQDIQTGFMEFLNKEYVIGKKILEVGAGNCPIKGVTVATDYSKSIANPDVVTGIDVLNLPFKDKSFDLVICRNFISCFNCMGKPELKEKALAEMYRVGKSVHVREFNHNLCVKYYFNKDNKKYTLSAAVLIAAAIAGVYIWIQK